MLYSVLIHFMFLYGICYSGSFHYSPLELGSRKDGYENLGFYQGGSGLRTFIENWITTSNNYTCRRSKFVYHKWGWKTFLYNFIEEGLLRVSFLLCYLLVIQSVFYGRYYFIGCYSRLFFCCWRYPILMSMLYIIYFVCWSVSHTPKI